MKSQTERIKKKKKRRGRILSNASAVMDLRSELLKSIWYAFTALDVEKSGKVSKSQLKVSNRTKISSFRPLISSRAGAG